MKRHFGNMGLTNNFKKHSSEAFQTLKDLTKVKYPANLNKPVSTLVKGENLTLPQWLSVGQAIEVIRRFDLGERAAYFYVIDDDERLVGVVPSRRLLIEPLNKTLSDIMIRNVVTITEDAKIYHACSLFATHRFLALPVVDGENRITGVIDVSEVAHLLFDSEEEEATDEIFEIIGFRTSPERLATPLVAFRYRFPWLISTIIGGTLCALVASHFEITLANSIILAFFLTLVLGLGESVSIQSMTLTIHALRFSTPTFRWYLASFRREVATAVLLGSLSGSIVGTVVWLWRGTEIEAIVIGISVLCILIMACFLGLSIPALLHALKVDLKIAAGPLTLAIIDIFTMICYLGIASLLL